MAQAQDAYQDWLLDASQAGVLVTPLAHAQLNIVGFVREFSRPQPEG
jgi:hypothetical protein